MEPTDRRKAIMIESIAYDIIKQDGIAEGIKEGIEQGIKKKASRRAWLWMPGRR